MNKKSFFRGFGFGVIFASLILGISFVVRTSDAYVTARAKELGMVYETDTDDSKLLAEKTPSPTVSEVPEEKEDTKNKEVPSAAKETEAPSVPTPDIKTNESTTKSPSDEAKDIKKQLDKEKKNIEDEIKKERDKENQKKQNQQKKLVIDAGDMSFSVSKKLEELGIVKSARDFDKYLNDKGYAISINAGTYDVSMEDTYAELARKITRR